MDARTDIDLEMVPADAAFSGDQPSLSQHIVLLFGAACGLSVANVYFAHPLLDAVARTFSIESGAIGFVITVTQIGYALGLIFIVPLGDLMDRRRLIVGQLILSAAALTIVGTASNTTILLVGMFVVGLMAVVVQVLVAFAATLAAPEERGRVVGMVTSGVVIGILLARLVSGTLSDLGGWRSVYLASAALTLSMAGLLFRILPRHSKEATAPSYRSLLRSVVALFREEPVLRVRAALALLIFADFNVLWAPLALPLSAAPYSLSHTQIGLFGLAGIAGALAAGRAGLLADRGLGQYTTGLSLGLMLVAWLPIALMGASLWALIAGVLVLDLAIQAVHVTSQSMLFAVRPDAGSRLVGAYMSFYSIGSASGAIAATSVYAHAGWTGVCALGSGISAVAFLLWVATRHRQCR
jgi:predicted MFS family arabinose efflux permease